MPSMVEKASGTPRQLVDIGKDGGPTSFHGRLIPEKACKSPSIYRGARDLMYPPVGRGPRTPEDPEI